MARAKHARRRESPGRSTGPASIFVQIAAYRDDQLVPTLVDLIDQAASPRRLRVAVCWQHGVEQSLDEFVEQGFRHVSTRQAPAYIGDFFIHGLERKGCRLQLIDVHYIRTHGACWARNRLQQLYAGERYTLQLDSHHRFVPRYDEQLIEMLEGLRRQSPRPMLTAYLPSFDPDNDPAARVQVPWLMDFDHFTPEGVALFIPSDIPDWQARHGKPLRARFYSGHFTFTDGAFARDVRHDPEFFFHGEEISLAVRAYTHGYDPYHPTVPLAWHEYTRRNRVKVWDDHSDDTKKSGHIETAWWERDLRSKARNRALLGMSLPDDPVVDPGAYGLGTVRTLRDYERYAGISFRHHSVRQSTLDRDEPPDGGASMEHADWLASLATRRKVLVRIPRDQFTDDPSAHDLWSLAFQDAQGAMVCRHTVARDRFAGQVGHSQIELPVEFLSTRDAVRWTMTVRHQEHGWGQTLEGELGPCPASP